MALTLVLTGCPGPATTDGGLETSVTDGGDATPGDANNDARADVSADVTTDVVPTDAADVVAPDVVSDVPVVTDTVPTMVTRAVDCGTVCRRPTDAVLNAPGNVIYFTAFTAAGVPAVFTAPAGGGTPTVVTMAGGLDFPVSIAISDDDATLFIADQSADGMTAAQTAQGAVFSVPAAGGTLTRLNIGALTGPSGIAVEGNTLIVSGWQVPGAMMAPVPSLVRMPVAGGSPTTIVMGTGFSDPSDVSVIGAEQYAVNDTGHGFASGQALTVGTAATAIQSNLVSAWPAGIAASQGGTGRLVSGWPADGMGPRLIYVRAGMPFAPLTEATLRSPTGAGRARSSNTYVVADELSGTATAAGSGAIFVVR